MKIYGPVLFFYVNESRVGGGVGATFISLPGMAGLFKGIPLTCIIFLILSFFNPQLKILFVRH